MAWIMSRRPAIWLRISGATVLVFSLLVITGVFGIYYLKLGRYYRYFARVANFKGFRHVVPLVPLFALTLPTWLAVSSPIPGAAATTLWVLVGFTFVELYSTGLYVRSAETSASAMPRPILWRASWHTKRESDLRLHRLFEVHVIYIVAPAVTAALVTWNQPAPAIISTLFLVRYFCYALDFYDFEAVVHWHMHTRSMVIEGRPGASRIIAFLMNYVVGPAVGYVPRLYEIAHPRVHHRYDSGPGAPYSPMPYRRTSLIEFSWFAMLVITSDLTAWAQLARRRLSRRWRRVAILNLVGYWLVVLTLIVLQRPLGALLLLFALLHGLDQAKSQYKWHGLPDPDNLEDPLGTTILWVTSEAAWRQIAGLPASVGESSDGPIVRDWTYFDNYHLVHHLYPSAHFDRYIELLRRRAPDIITARGVVMALPAILTSAFAMWSGDIDSLASALLTEPTPGIDKHEFIKRRLEPVPSLRHPQGAVFDYPLIRHLDRHLTRTLGAIINF